MRHSHPRQWQIRRLVRLTKPMVHPESRLIRMTNHPDSLPSRLPDRLPELRAEAPGPDGIRHALVAHVKQLIADGVYDTPERWERATQKLHRHLEQLDGEE